MEALPTMSHYRSGASPHRESDPAENKGMADPMADMNGQHMATVQGTIPVLPKGIVANTSEIYLEVASYETVPEQRLKEYWHVYTTTHRRLYDPTASRLESFWWHVWGSDRRHLSGETLAALYRNISTGPTFVPLHGPADQYEGLMTRLHLVRQESRENGGDQRVTSRSSTREPEISEKTASDQDLSIEAGSIGLSPPRAISSSSSRPPPSQSILKKPRPSLSGPRPTPRFALPSGEPSEDEGEDDAQKTVPEDAGKQTTATPTIASSDMSTPEANQIPDADTSFTSTADTSTSSAGTQRSFSNESQSSRTRGATASKPDTRKLKSKAVKKKFVASSATSKRKAVVSKRSNSHSSAGSVGSDVMGPRDLLPPSLGRSSPTLIEEEEPEAPHPESSSQLVVPGPESLQQIDASSNANVTQYTSPLLSAKAAGKRPMPSLIQSMPRQPDVMPKTQTQASAKAGAQPASATSRGPVPVTRSQWLPPSPLAAPVSEISATSGSLESVGESDMLEIRAANRSRTSVNQPFERVRRLGGRPMSQQATPIYPDDGRKFIIDPGRSAPVIGSPSTSQAEFTSGIETTAVPQVIPPRLSRSLSQDGYGQRSPRGIRPILSLGRGQSSVAVPITSPSIVASGVLLDTEGPDPFDVYAQTGLDAETAGEWRPISEGSPFSEQGSVQRPLFAPTRPSQTPRIPFARTRSQLNIILDREKERLGEGNFASWRESRARDHHQEDGHN